MRWNFGRSKGWEGSKNGRDFIGIILEQFAAIRVMDDILNIREGRNFHRGFAEKYGGPLKDFIFQGFACRIILDFRVNRRWLKSLDIF